MSERQAGGGALKLRAEDAEDLRVIAACLQDALISLSDVRFDANEHRFILVANRFRWENCTETADMPVMPVDGGDDAPVAEVADAAFNPACASYERVNCGICFENVSQVRRRGFDPRDRGRILELLTMDVETGAAGSGSAVILVFAGGAAIRLEGQNITCKVGDIGDPWPTQWRPYHPADQTA